MCAASGSFVGLTAARLAVEPDHFSPYSSPPGTSCGAAIAARILSCRAEAQRHVAQDGFLCEIEGRATEVVDYAGSRPGFELLRMVYEHLSAPPVTPHAACGYQRHRDER
jgi:hypothetical protein